MWRKVPPNAQLVVVAWIGISLYIFTCYITHFLHSSQKTFSWTRELYKGASWKRSNATPNWLTEVEFKLRDTGREPDRDGSTGGSQKFISLPGTGVFSVPDRQRCVSGRLWPKIKLAFWVFYCMDTSFKQSTKRLIKCKIIPMDRHAILSSPATTRTKRAREESRERERDRASRREICL